MAKKRSSAKQIAVPPIRYLARISVPQSVSRSYNKRSRTYHRNKDNSVTVTARVPAEAKDKQATVIRTRIKVFNTKEAMERYVEKKFRSFLKQKKTDAFSASFQKFSGKVRSLKDGRIEGGVSKSARLKAIKRGDRFRLKKFNDGLIARGGAMEVIDDLPFQIYEKWSVAPKLAGSKAGVIKRSMRVKEKKQLKAIEDKWKNKVAKRMKESLIDLEEEKQP